jgi:hypothetical protein
LGERLACNEEVRVRLPTSPSASVVSTSARALCTAEVRVRFLPEAFVERRRSGRCRQSRHRRRTCDMSNARSSEDEHCLAKAGDAGSTPAGRTRADVAQHGRAPGRQPGGARSIRVVRFTGLWCNRQHGELQPRESGFDSWQACSSRAGVGRLSEGDCRDSCALRTSVRPGLHHTTVTISLPRAEAVRLSHLARSPPGDDDTTAAATNRGPERVGYLTHEQREGGEPSAR